MSYFDREKKPFGGRRDSFGDRGPRRGGGGGGWDSERPEMHKATCAECGSSCEVPFRPNGEKPVYCSDCFESQKSSRPRREERGFDDRRSSDRSSPERSSAPSHSGNNDQTNNKLEKIEMKLDTLINLLSLSLHGAKGEKPAKSLETKEVKAVTKEEVSSAPSFVPSKKDKAPAKEKKPEAKKVKAKAKKK